jgi:hypothetical protein
LLGIGGWLAQQPVVCGQENVCSAAFGASKVQSIKRWDSPGFELLSTLNLWLSDDDWTMSM